MRFEKWYLDCVAPDGAGMIGYAARVGFGPLSLRAGETMHWRAGEPPAPSRATLGGNLPQISPEAIDWANPGLGVVGQWRSLIPAMPVRTLHQETAGRIQWTCFCPAADTSVSLPGQPVAGLGYVERLVMTLPVDRLPLRELHWGRFIASGQSFTWLRWVGPAERSWTFHNGLAVTATASGLQELSWDEHRLQLSDGTVLRSGRVGETVLDGVRWLRRMLPAAVRNLVETKWCSAGCLTDAGGVQHRGWAIHELVRFS